MAPLDPVACAALFLSTFVIAGVAQTAWFASPRSRAFAWPLDGGLTFRGQRLFGSHKTLRGLMVMVPAVTIVLPLAAIAFDRALPAPSGLWRLTPPDYARLGAWSGLGFMLGELPNSFVKRQVGISPGGAAEGRGLAWQLLADRLDSAFGLLIAASVVVHVPLTTWLILLGIGPLLHWSFSVLLFRLGLKARPA